MYKYLESVKLSKWQIALLVGAPIAIGIGVYAYRRTKEPKKFDPYDDEQNSTKTKSTEDQKKNLKAKNSTQSLSIDVTAEDKELESKKKSVELESVDLSPFKEATMLKNEGNTCYRNGKYDEAIIFYDKAIDKCPKDKSIDMAIFYQNRAASYEMLKKWNCVKEDCTKSLEYNPRYAKAYLRRAKACEATNELHDCLDDITAACILEMFQNNSTILFADRILKQTGGVDAEEWLKKRVPILPSACFINTYLRSFVNDPIITLTLPFSAVSAEVPTGFVRAKLALDAERYDEIIPACTEEIELSEAASQYISEALLLRGTFHLLAGSFAEAKQDLDAVINNNNADKTLQAYAYIRRAALNMQMEDKDHGLEDFKEAEKLTPDNADVYHQRAQVFILLDLLTEAMEEFEKALKIAPNHAMAHVQKCYAEYRYAILTSDNVRLMMVINEFRNAIEKFPNCVECYSLMAQVLCEQQQFAQADKFYEKAIKIAPNNASLYVHRGILLLQWTGNINQTLELMEKAIEIDDKCELAYETYGTIEVQRANLEKAIDLFNKAMKIAKSKMEIVHLCALRNAAVAQINVTRKLQIDMTAISALAQSGVLQPPAAVQN